MDQTSRRRRTLRATAVLVLIANASVIAPALALTPLGTAFTYQGQLKNNGSPASGAFTMTFALFDAATAGAQVGPTLVCDGSAGNPPPVTVSGGVFTVTLDFGATPYTTNEAR